MKNINYISVLVCLMFLTFTVLSNTPACAQDAGDEFTDVVDEGDVESDIEDEEDLSGVTDDLDFIQEDIEAELEESPNKALRAVEKKIDKLVGLLEDTVAAIEDEELEDCGDSLDNAANLLEKIINQIEHRQCKGSKISKRCISSDLAEEFLGDLEDLLDTLDEIISTDDDEDDIPDVCGFSG